MYRSRLRKITHTLTKMSYWNQWDSTGIDGITCFPVDINNLTIKSHGHMAVLVTLSETFVLGHGKAVSYGETYFEALSRGFGMS